MDPLTLLSLIVGVVGTGIAAAVAFRGRQLSRPRLRVAVASAEPESRLPRGWRSAPLGGIVIGTADRSGGRTIACPFALTNISDVPITDLAMRLEYPIDHLVEQVVFVNQEKTAAHVFRFKAMREIFKMGRIAHVSFDLGLLRPGDTMLTAELFALKAFGGTSAQETTEEPQSAQRLQKRYGEVGELVGLFPVNVYFRAGNMQPQGLAFTILWLQASSVGAVSEGAMRLVDASWDGLRPQPGTYLTLRARRLRKAIRRRERFRLLFIDETIKAPMNPDALLEKVLGAENGDALFYIPPWGLSGESFDLQSLLGVRIGGRRETV